MSEEEKEKFLAFLKMYEEYKKAAADGAVIIVDERYADPEEAAAVCVFGMENCSIKTVVSTYKKRPIAVIIKTGGTVQGEDAEEAGRENA